MTNQIVRKPWGFEYRCFSNDEVAIWTLHIDKGKATSLHCHPRKNTALIILQGEIELSFIRDAIPHRFYGLDKINIFRGRFHRTKAVSEGVVLLEVEAPDDKRDIVRLEDDYGRAANPIEEATVPLTPGCLQLRDGDRVQYFAGCSLSIAHPSTSREIPQEGGQHVYVTLSGGLERGLVPVGDAIDGATLSRFTRAFKPVFGTTFLHIWRLGIFLTTAGCASSTDGWEITVAQKQCLDHGGVDYIHHVTKNIQCNDGKRYQLVSN